MNGSPLPGPGQLYDEAPCGLMLASRQGEVLHANPTFERWLQYPSGEMAGKVRFQDLLTVGGRIFHQTHLGPLLRMQGSVAEVKLELRRTDGQLVPMLLNLQERPWRDGEVLLHVAAFVAEDRHKYEQELLAQRRRAEELAQQHARDQEELAAAHAESRDRALFAEQLVGMVSHDIRNPLSVIDLSTLLLRKGGLTPMQQTVVDRVSRSVKRVQHLVGDLLDFTQARLGRGLSVRAESVDLHHAVAEAVAELALAFPGRTITHTHEGHGNCVADAQRITQAVGNLVANAANHGASDRPIIVHTQPVGSTFCISVHNWGEPIPPAALTTLFQPMIRGAGKLGGEGGVGLGLYIVERIVQAHGGAVHVRSTAQEGTSFTLSIPHQRPAG